jgi:hypothetical protein
MEYSRASWHAFKPERKSLSACFLVAKRASDTKQTEDGMRVNVMALVRGCSKMLMFNQKTGQIGCNLPTKLSAILKREKAAQLVGLILSKFDTLDSNATSKTPVDVMMYGPERAYFHGRIAHRSPKTFRDAFSTTLPSQ